jgi:sn-glycerol 3-phosphate transport system permease protein
VLLAAFTHWPALATLWHSAMSTPKKARPSRFVGLDNYRAMVEDEVFWQALWNNLIFAAGTIPLSIALAIAMALWVNGRIRGRGFLRLAYFTPTVLPMIAVANIWLFFYTRSTACSSRSRRRSACRATTGSATSRPCSAR